MKNPLNYLMQQGKTFWRSVVVSVTFLFSFRIFICLCVLFCFCKSLFDTSACWEHSRSKFDVRVLSLHVLCGVCCVGVCIPDAAENAVERKQQRTDAECQPYAVAPSPSRCADRWEPSGWVSWDRRQYVSAPRWGTCAQQAEDEWQIYCGIFEIDIQNLIQCVTNKNQNNLVATFCYVLCVWIIENNHKLFKEYAKAYTSKCKIIWGAGQKTSEKWVLKLDDVPRKL